eukprot:1721864-Amphidinium_carterae.1
MELEGSRNPRGSCSSISCNCYVPSNTSLQCLLEADNLRIVLDNGSEVCCSSSTCMVYLCDAVTPEGCLITQDPAGCRKLGGTIAPNFLERSSAGNGEAVELAQSPNARPVWMS